MSVPNARRSASATTTTKAASPTASKRWDCLDRPTKGVDGRLSASFRVPKMEREFGYAPPEDYIFRVLTDKLGDELWPKLANAGRHTIDLKLTTERRYDFSGDCDEHRLEADLCPVEMRRMTMDCWEPPAPVWEPPPPPPPRPPTPPPPSELLSQHAYRVLAAWCREMTSETVYDGPYG